MDPNSVDLVIYHADCSDGFGAAYAAWRLLGSRAEYLAAKHDATYSGLPDVKGKNVVLLDFAYDRPTCERLIEDAKGLMVIDHHESAMVRMHGIPNCHFDLTKSGAILAWEFFHPGKEPPKFLRYIEDRDLWKWELEYSKEFSAAFDMVPFEFDAFDKHCDDSVFDDTARRGSYIREYARTFIAKIVKKAVRRKLGGYDALVVNSSHWISEIGENLSKSASVALIWFYDHEEKQYKCSLRSAHDDINVGVLASKFEGGGHPRAAGFVWEGASIEEIFDDPGEPEESTDEDPGSSGDIEGESPLPPDAPTGS